MKRNKGITLIALVITIIVLLILAGVAIAMLSGENGILKKAAEAKTKTEDGQDQEEKALTTMELTTYFLMNNSKYKCRYGYVTGVIVENNISVDTISNLKNKLPKGYYVVPKGKENLKEEEVDESELLTTGTAIKNENDVIARVVILGDVDCSGGVSTEDINEIQKYCGKEENRKEYMDYQVVAMNIYNDEFIGDKDTDIIFEILQKKKKLEDYQKIEIKNPNKIIIKNKKEAIELYISTLTPQNSKYEWKYIESIDKYRVTGEIVDETTGNDIIDGLGLTGKAYIRRTTVDEEENEKEEEITTTAVQKGDEIVLKDEEIIYGQKIDVLATIWRK